MRRRLRFGLTLTLLREHILAETNAVFAQLNLGALAFDGLPVADDIRGALVALETGSKPFVDLLPIIQW
ncbi:MAG TPA: hypothetical protein DCK98_01155 [Chloroflexi bacterium]|jgi:hypothetical protein|nr:hypothetical protein [Chloroflexota bacterium]HAL27660.1 hypothetical protein [Chloroflexota bacterium]